MTDVDKMIIAILAHLSIESDVTSRENCQFVIEISFVAMAVLCVLVSFSRAVFKINRAYIDDEMKKKNIFTTK